MSSPVDIGAVFGQLLNAITNAFQTLVQVIADNMPTLVELGLIAGLVGGVAALTTRYVRSFSDLFRRIIPF